MQNEPWERLENQRLQPRNGCDLVDKWQNFISNNSLEIMLRQSRSQHKIHLNHYEIFCH